MNDNLDPAAIARLEQLLRQQIVEAARPTVSGYQPRKPLPMPNGKNKTIEINLEHAGALIVGDNANVTVNVGDEKKSGVVISPDPLLHLDELVTEVAEAKSADPATIRTELASVLGIPDLAFVTAENVSDAIRVLQSWQAQSIRDAVNDTH